jgi:hypothetical protein
MKQVENGYIGFDEIIRSRILRQILKPIQFTFIVLSFRATETTLAGTRTQYIFRGSDFSKISSRSQGISMPSLGQIIILVLELQANIHTYPQFQFYM